MLISCLGKRSFDDDGDDVVSVMVMGCYVDDVGCNDGVGQSPSSYHFSNQIGGLPSHRLVFRISKSCGGAARLHDLYVFPSVYVPL